MDEIIKILREGDDFVLAGHTSPDGDSIGSCSALAMALHAMGKNVRMLAENYPRRLANIPGREFLFCGDMDELSPQIFVAVDCGDVDRLGAVHAVFSRAKTTICIDHHDTNTGFADVNYIEPHASSASEMIFKIISRLTEITPDMAAAVYAGMVSDTGGFRFDSTAASTMETAARLMQMIPFTQIYSEIMHSHTFAGGKALGLAIENSERTEDKKVVYTFMTRQMLRSVGANHSEMDGVVEYLMGTRKALMAVFVYEKWDGIKVSLRSLGPNAGRVAAKLGGGGHILAAGAKLRGTIENVLELAVSLAEREVAAFESINRVEEKKAVREPSPMGVINIRKEKDYTSNDVVAIVRKITGAKTGHTGTLDPNATGVLPICLGRATKFAEQFTASDKSYTAEIVLGIVTDTGDTTGEVTMRRDASAVSLAELKEAAESFLGEYNQVPPMYSAIKIGGKRLYQLAREGKTVKRNPRRVKISEMRLWQDGEKFFMDVTCSKGTYIRSLCMDIGEKLGCGAVMGDLTRTRSGFFRLENSHTLDEVRAAAKSGRLGEIILPLTKILPYKTAVVSPEGVTRAISGNHLLIEFVPTAREVEPGEKCWLFTDFGELIGLYERTNKKFVREVLVL